MRRYILHIHLCAKVSFFIDYFLCYSSCYATDLMVGNAQMRGLIKCAAQFINCVDLQNAFILSYNAQLFINCRAICELIKCAARFINCVDLQNVPNIYTSDVNSYCLPHGQYGYSGHILSLP